VKKNRGKIILFLLFTGLSLYFLYPTYKDYQFTKELRGLVGEDSLKYIEQNEEAMREARSKRVKLGLDLQGGMRVVLEVNVLKYLEDIAKNKDEQFNTVISEVRTDAQTSEEDIVDMLGRKLQEKQLRAARYYGSIRDEDDVIMQKLKDETVSAVDRAIEIVRNRIDQYGVSEPSIQKQGGRRIIVELPGVSKEGEVRQLLQGTALLEFKILYDAEIMSKVYQAIDASLAGKPVDDSLNVNKSDTTKSVATTDTTAKPADTTSTTAKVDSAKPADTSLATLENQPEKTPEEIAKEHPFFAIANPMQQPNQGWSGQLYTIEEDKPKVNRILERPDIKQLIPSGVSFSWSAKKAFTAEGKNFFALYATKKEAELTGGVITNARATIDPNFNTPIVTMEMNTEGSREWARITGSNVNKQIAIVLDNACFSAPVVRGKITGGNSQIEGMDNVEEAKLLEIVLKAGALPAPVDIIQQTSVGPSLGEDSIKQGIYSSLMALVLTVIFMIFYYRMGGTAADVVLFLNMLFMLAVLAGFQGTLTLPGIAGIILTMAVAVDANVLIYERIREESASGKTL
jgi:preprotein translocase subunit SecD